MMADKAAKREWFESLTSREQKNWQKKKDWEAVLRPEHNAAMADRARKRMGRVDDLPAEIRRVVHEFGLEIVWEFWTYRVERAHAMRVLIRAAQAAEDQYCDNLQKLFRSHGLRETRRIDYLIAVARNDPHPDGNNRFRANCGPNRRRNPLEDEDDGTEYFVTGRQEAANVER